MKTNTIFAQAIVLAAALMTPIDAANAGDYDTAPNRSVATASDYVEMGIPVPQAPTAERPYHYVRFDAKTKAQYPQGGPNDVLPLNGEKLVVLNFLDESNRFSAMQTQVLEQTLKALAPRSEHKELMLVDVAVRDAQGENLYVADYMAFFEENSLPVYKHTLEPESKPHTNSKPSNHDKIAWYGHKAAQIPYGVVYGDPLKDCDERKLFDFALMNGVKTKADLNANANSISGKLYITVYAYNQNKLEPPARSSQ